MKKRILLLPLLFFSIAVYAEKVLVANCSEGQGCTFTLSDVDVDLAGGAGDDVYNDIKSNSILVFGKRKDGTEVKYVENSKTRSTIDRDWGGDGYTMIHAFNPIIQPLGGIWKANYGSATGNDCYGIGNMGAFIQRTIQPGLAGTGEIVFAAPFSPAQLFPVGEHMKWRQVSYNNYVGVMDFGSSAAAGMKLYYKIKVVDQKRIETVYDIEVKIPVKGTCKGTVPVTFTLVKANDQDDPLGNEELVADDLLPVHTADNPDDLMPVNPKKDDLLPVQPGKKPKTNVEQVGRPKVERIED